MTATTRTIQVDERFSLDKTLQLNTQDFRWNCWRDGAGVPWHSGVLKRHLVHIHQTGQELQYHASDDANLDEMLRSYFRLGDDIETIREELASVDNTMAKLVAEFAHLRVLRQPDPWETTVAFMCSATNSIKGTTTRVERIACRVGKRVVLDGEQRWGFPSPEAVLQRQDEVRSLALGLDRESKVLDVAARVRGTRGRPLDLPALARSDVPYAEARWQLLFSRGIGPKVADCIGLFALGKAEAFPVDRWVKESVKRHYFNSKKVPFGDDLVRWGQERFGANAGYASQLLFLSSYTASKEP